MLTTVVLHSSFNKTNINDCWYYHTNCGGKATLVRPTVGRVQNIQAVDDN